jgi:hypothetical protein
LGLRGKLDNWTWLAIYLGSACENVGHHRVWFPDLEAISETPDVFFDLLEGVDSEDWDTDEELVPPVLPPKSATRVRCQVSG